MQATRPDVVSVNTYPDTHAAYVRAALDAGCHVFCEKPLAETVAEAQSLVDAARAANRKLVIGYILRVHPAWQKFIELARTLGKPLVMRMNLNQQSDGDMWTFHKNLMGSMSPIVDCGVHYVDVMCQMTGARPVRVSAIGARLSDELKPGMYNYGQLQVTFDDGSVGWYEAGWGPDDERGRLLREGRRRPEGLRVDRQGSERRDGGRIGRHRQPHEDELHPGALRATSTRPRSSPARTSSSAPRTSRITRGSATASSSSCCAPSRTTWISPTT